MIRRRIRLVAAAAALVLAGSLAWFVGPAPVAQATTSGCSVTYRVLSQWPQGFQAQVTFTATGAPLHGWQLEFDFPLATQRVDHGWSADWQQEGRHVIATPMSWNGDVALGQTVAVGFVGSYSGTNPVPTGFKVNGSGCGGAGITEY